MAKGVHVIKKSGCIVAVFCMSLLLAYHPTAMATCHDTQYRCDEQQEKSSAIKITISPKAVCVGREITVNATYTDENDRPVEGAVLNINLGDGVEKPADTDKHGKATVLHTYDAPDLYEICVSVSYRPGYGRRKTCEDDRSANACICAYASSREEMAKADIFVYDVKSVIITPVGAVGYNNLPDPVRLVAGAVDSPASKAYVDIQVEPQTQGIPVKINMEGGHGFRGGDARLEIDGVVISGDGDSAIVRTGDKGIIGGEIISGNVNNVLCTIHAGRHHASVITTWGDCVVDEWEYDSEGRELRDGDKFTVQLTYRYADAEDAPTAPMIGHEIRFFAERFDYRDEDGNEHTVKNTSQNPKDVTRWVEFDNPYFTDEEGRVSVEVTVHGDYSLTNRRVRLYDSSAFKEGVLNDQ